MSKDSSDSGQSVPRLDVRQIMRRVRAEVARRRGQEPRADRDLAEFPPSGPITLEEHFPRWKSTVQLDASRREFVLDEFLATSDRTFVEAVYRALLRRDPDPQGREHYLSGLRSGALSKLDILGELRWSPEGLAHGVHVDGLLVPYTLRRWKRNRFVGPVVAWLHAFVRLGRLSDRIQYNEAAMAHETHAMGNSFNQMAGQIEDRFIGVGLVFSQQARGVEARLDALSTTLDESESQLRSEFEHAQSIVRNEFDKLDQRVGEANHEGQKKNQAAQQLVAKLSSSVEAVSLAQASIVDRIASMQSHLEMLQPFPAALVVAQQALVNLTQRQAEAESALKAIEKFELKVKETREHLAGELERLRATLETEVTQRVNQEALLSRHESEIGEHRASLQSHGAVLGLAEQAKARDQESARALDPMYAAFEDRFRGDVQLVRTRAEPYLPLVTDAGAGTGAAPILDLGSGRGEWLDLLRDNGLVGRGIDSNRVFVQLCQGRGLDVIEGDIIDVMHSLPDMSIGAITGMHIAEHLPFEVLVRLLDEARRLLVPGGLLALETPNPENLQVATQLFYMDPTHRNPLPPEAFRWLVEARGFDGARIERWTIARDMNAPPLLDAAIPGADSMNVLLAKMSVAPDYSVIARRGPA